MNILQIEPAVGFSGGVNQTILNSIELKKRGHGVYIACCRNSAVAKALDGVVDGFVFIDDERKRLSASLIKDFLSSNNIQIVHTHHSKGHTIGLLALMFRWKEKLVVQRSVIFPPRNPFKYLNPRVNVFVANSEAVRKELLKYLVPPKRIRVIYSALDASRLNPEGKERVRDKYGFSDEFVFGVVANYSQYKGHELLLEAFARVKNRGKALLVFVGRNTEKLEKRAEELGILDRVKLLGFREDAHRMIEAFDCLVVPSLKESFPNVAIEAFFYKTPVIGTDVGGVPELLSDGRGIVVKPQAEALAGAMLYMYSMADRKGMTEKAYRFAIENLIIERKVDRLEALYGELVS